MKEQILKEFEDKYSSFELCNQVSKPELDKLKQFISQAIDKTREETIRDVLFNYSKFLNDNCKECETIELTIENYLKSLNKLKK